MRRRYQKWMYDWETRLTTRDTNRVVRPFEWGLEWARAWPGVDGRLPAGEPLAGSFRALNHALVAESDRFFAYATPADFRLERHVPAHFTAREGRAGLGDAKRKAPYLRFTSPVPSPYEENNTVSARWFPARGRRAVVLLPQWNSDAEGHNALGKLLNLAGIAALRMSMPYHDVRMPRELERADYAVSSNLARTIAAARQAVIEVRCCLDWLQQQGYTNLGILGTSLGSCYAFIAAAHDPRLRVCAFNHASTYFADVVWTGQSTRHIRAGVEPAIALDELRDCWLSISPMAYFDKFQRFPRKSLIVYATYDLTFLPEFSRQVVAEFERRKLEHEVAVLPCGHYTTGESPFKYVDAYKLISFFRRSF
ncbi:MAG TPA: alpha/beta hydrolase family protein [Terriglobales bacterium]|nr:alpha/beta hydrolase family protein [Terriglobales bacterium]